MIWKDNVFAKKYATMNASGSDPFESEGNELSLIGLMPDGTETILDFGCSGGHFTDRLSKEHKVTGYDIAPSARKVAKEAFPDLDIVDTVTGKFDCIILKLVLHLLDNPSELLNKLTENLAENGCFVISLTHPIYYAVRHGIDYEKTDEFTYDAMDEPANIQYWRPLKYWVELFNRLGFVMTKIDEIAENEETIPKRFNARFDRKRIIHHHQESHCSGAYYYFKYRGAS
jgi:SAM-dependent methyltransferase